MSLLAKNIKNIDINYKLNIELKYCQGLAFQFKGKVLEVIIFL